MNKKTKRKNEGITLIALVVSIVVLLILAGVSIATLTGENGILTQAQNAKTETENKAIEEQRKLAQTEARLNLENKEYVDKNNEKAIIPAGFAVSPFEEEQTIKTGLVVIGEDGSEFVWVPVSNINNMAQCSSVAADSPCNLVADANGHLSCKNHSNNTFIVGKLYATTVGESFSNTANTTYNADSGLREPAIVKDFDNDTENYNKVGLTLDGLKKDYKLMAESVKKYGGFYVGRYEASLSTATVSSAGTSGTMQSKSGVKPTAANNSFTRTWYGLYEKAKGYTISEGSVQSSMIWGSQYDAMLNWVKSSGSSDASKIRTQGIGNNTSNVVSTTGNSTYSNDSINKIRDLGGNLREWTLETNDTQNRVLRGGYYNAGNTPRFRNTGSFNVPNWYGANCGTRLTLYIK